LDLRVQRAASRFGGLKRHHDFDFVLDSSSIVAHIVTPIIHKTFRVLSIPSQAEMGRGIPSTDARKLRVASVFVTVQPFGSQSNVLA